MVYLATVIVLATSYWKMCSECCGTNASIKRLENQYPMPSLKSCSGHLLLLGAFHHIIKGSISTSTDTLFDMVYSMRQIMAHLRIVRAWFSMVPEGVMLYPEFPNPRTSPLSMLEPHSVDLLAFLPKFPIQRLHHNPQILLLLLATCLHLNGI